MTMYGRQGTLTKQDDVNVISFTRTFATTPERVWEALTTVGGITAWLAPRASIDARLGGSIEFEFDEENLVVGEITRFEPYTNFAYTWVIGGTVPSAVHYELSRVDDGTDMRLVHSGLPDDMCGGYTPGWHAYLARLDATMTGEEPPTWLDAFHEVATLYG